VLGSSLVKRVANQLYDDWQCFWEAKDTELCMNYVILPTYSQTVGHVMATSHNSGTYNGSVFTLVETSSIYEHRHHHFNQCTTFPSISFCIIPPAIQVTKNRTQNLAILGLGIRNKSRLQLKRQPNWQKTSHQKIDFKQKNDRPHCRSQCWHQTVVQPEECQDKYQFWHSHFHTNTQKTMVTISHHYNSANDKKVRSLFF